MAAQLLDGKLVAASLLERVKNGCAARRQQGLRPPCLAVIMVGEDPASAIYVRNKQKKCGELGIRSLAFTPAAACTQEELLTLIVKLNLDSEVDGILVQLPLPPHIDSAAVIEAINPHKDVDGFHPYNMGRLLLKRPLLRPCTPKGVMFMLAAYKLTVAGKNAVIIGQSNIVGRPMALEMLLARATITVCHSATHDLAAEVQRADIVIAAAGKAKLIRGEWIKPGAIVIDVGINRANGSLCGDVDFTPAAVNAAYITPVPGGVGVMTIAALMDNTLIAANLCAGEQKGGE